MKDQIQQSSTSEQNFELDNDQIESFSENGWISAYPLLQPLQCRKLIKDYSERRNLLTHLDNEQQLYSILSGSKIWTKSFHGAFPKVCKILSDPRIIGRVRCLLGNDVLLWGSSVVTRVPGRIHKWHVDWEHLQWKGVTVFIGLTGITKESSLKVIPGSHRFMSPVSIDARVDSDEEVLVRAERFQKNSIVKIVELREGEFMIFDGPIWHGSQNRHSQTRFALLAQYTTPDSKVRVPLSKFMKYGASIKSDIDREEFSPPCVLVSGENRFEHNNLMPLPD